MSHNKVRSNGNGLKDFAGLIVMANKTLRLGGRPMDEILASDMPTLVKRVLTEVVAQVPAYQQLPVEELSGDITRIIHQTLQGFITVLRTATQPSAQELAFVRESAARRAEEGIPIDMVLTAYHVGVEVVWEALTPEVRPDDVDDVMTASSLVLRYLALITPAVAAGYLEQSSSIVGDEQSARHALLSALLEGRAGDEGSGRAGLAPAPGYLVLALAVGPHPDENVEGIDDGVVARRKLRRIRTALDRSSRGQALSSLTVDGGTVLVPMATAQPSTSDWTAVEQLATTLRTAAGADITVGAAAAEPTGVVAAAKVAREVLDVAQRTGRPPGVYQLDDVLLDYQLSQPSAARERLARLLDPVADSAELLGTVQAFLRLGGRRETARELHVHPNTVDYRLRRVQDLTGLDATRPGDISTLEAALAARRMSTTR